MLRDTHWEESGFEDSKDDAKRNKLIPLLDEAKADHGDAPENGDRWKECPWSDLAQNNSCWRLQQDVRDEENQDYDGISLSDEFEVDTHSSDNGNALYMSDDGLLQTRQ